LGGTKSTNVQYGLSHWFKCFKLEGNCCPILY